MATKLMSMRSTRINQVRRASLEKYIIQPSYLQIFPPRDMIGSLQIAFTGVILVCCDSGTVRSTVRLPTCSFFRILIESFAKSSGQKRRVVAYAL